MTSQEIAIEAERFPREDMLEKAVEFLTNSRVKPFSTLKKKSFLRHKGLTSEEVDIAIERSQRNLNTIPYRHETHLLHPVQSTVTPISWVQKFRDTLNVIVLVVATTYGLCYLCKSFIAPFLFGRGKKPKSVENSINDVNETMKKSLFELKRDVNQLHIELEKLLTVQTEQSYVTEINLLKSEVATVKGILLSRHQFPSVSLSTTSIPAWQLTGSSHKDDKEILENEDVEHNSGSSETEIVPNSNRNGGSQGSDSSLEMIKEVDA